MSLSAFCLLAASALLIACSSSTNPSAGSSPAKLTITTPPSATVADREVFPTQPAVQVADANGHAVRDSGVSVHVAVRGGGSLQGTGTMNTAADGSARFGGLAIAGVAGPKTLTFSAPSLASDSAPVTTTAGPPVSVTPQAGDNQTEAEGIAVSVPPAVRVSDRDSNGVPGDTVTFAVTGGGGTVTGAVQRTDSLGVATVGSWVLGVAGANTLSATAAGIGTPVAFTATARHLAVDSVVVTSSAALPLLPDSTAQLVATPLDSVGRPLSGRTITWSSGAPGVASVSDSGLVTAALPGSTSVTATSEGHTGAFSVTVVAPTLAATDGFTGHAGITLNGGGAPPTGYGYGYSVYRAIYPVNESQARDLQFGWGTWLIPNNLTFTNPLCPVGTYARDNWPTRGPTYRDVYETIEGGPGEWTSTQFPSSRIKFRVNGTPDCYTNEVASDAWEFGPQLLPANKLYLAQLSNHLLVPPDGLTFQDSVGFVGSAWMALPLIGAYTTSAGIPVGDQSWTLFLNAANFSGPVAFYTPEGWTEVNAVDQTGLGRSMDAQPIMAGSVAIEIGNAPYFSATDSTGTQYRRIPRMLFPADANGQSVVEEDLHFYSKQAIWDGVASWMQGGSAVPAFDAAGGVAPTMNSPVLDLRMNDSAIVLGTDFTAGVVTNAGGQQAFGFTWSGALQPGVFPEYYKEQAGQWVVVADSQVPRTTWLEDQTFALQQRGAYPAVDQAAGSPFDPAHWAAGPFTATLNDGSTVEYVWYKFTDQPAIARLALPAATLDSLQTFVDSLQAHATISFAGPSAGSLVNLDAGLFVSPPAGLELGYVPIVIDQY